MRKVLLHGILDVLGCKLELVETSTADHLQELEFVTDALNALVPFEAGFVGSVNWRRLALPHHPVGHEFGSSLVRDETDNDGDRERNGAEENRNTPLHAIESDYRESDTTDENDHDLTANHDTVDPDEEPIAGNAFKDVELVVKAAIAELG